MSITLARKLADLGASPEVIAVAVEAVTLASADVRGLSKDTSADKRREADKLRKRNERKLLKIQRELDVAKANDVATSVHDASADASAEDPKSRPTFLSNLSLNLEGSTEEGRKENKKARSENARARGQRMEPNAVLTDEWREAAIKLGAEPSEVPEMWAEHVDYWVAVPGERGVKTDWLATWRNDVRRKLKMGNRNGHKPRQSSLSERAFDLAEQARSAERAAGAHRPDEPVRGH